MKLDVFFNSFTQTGSDNSYSEKHKEAGTAALIKLPELSDLFQDFSGAIFNNGLFKIHNIGSSYLWTELTFEYFKKFKGNSYCFAFDWVGRQYAVNYNEGKTFILMLDPATAEAFTLEADIQSFLSDELDEFKNGVLEFEKFNTLSSHLIDNLLFSQCLGFKQFLFLGGKDELDNFEVIDMEVYWELSYQIYLKTKNLPSGTLIRNISIK